ncbi:MAG: type I glyceraldehyde-3-phosphate dehydrogenase [Dehalococcoidia bacterium]|nr:type I glyceraldehyde-3-phosphate dehydrogenase [Dehalococcoidia bacterium]
MSIRIGINGFGRIGRQVLRAALENHASDIEVVAVNDLTNTRTNAHLFKHDSSYGAYPGKVEAEGDSIIIDGKAVKVFAVRDPAQIPWREVGADIVIESTGIFTDAKQAAGHLEGGAKKVIISAPAKNEDITLVIGVNERSYDPKKHTVVSNASCTTNCIAPVVKVLHESFGVRRGLMSTIHSYTNDQRILDQAHEDLRRARSAALSIIPTTTGAARAVTLVLPELVGKIHGMAFRVPTPAVSVVDFVAEIDKDADIDAVNDAYRAAAGDRLRGILEVCEEELVSVDFKGDAHSAIVDAPSTLLLEKRMVKVIAWYDNEWGYSCRVADLASYMGQAGF